MNFVLKMMNPHPDMRQIREREDITKDLRAADDSLFEMQSNHDFLLKNHDCDIKLTLRAPQKDQNDTFHPRKVDFIVKTRMDFVLKKGVD